MSKDLSSMLDDDYKEPVMLASGDLGKLERKTNKVSKYALKHDKWSRHIGRKLRRSKKCPGALTHENLSDLFMSSWSNSVELLDPEKTESQVREYIEEVSSTPEFKAAKRQTLYNTIASELAAVQYARGYSEWRDARDKAEDMADGAGMSDEAKEDLKEAAGNRAARRAASRAREDAKEHNDTCEAFGLGHGDQADNSYTPEQEHSRRKLMDKIRRSDRLQKIVQLAGRYITLASTLQATKPADGAEEVIGVELGNSIEKCLPSDMMLLDDEDMEVEFYRRFTEHQLQQRELATLKDVGKGPIVLCIDRSSSMCGSWGGRIKIDGLGKFSRIEIAQAYGLAVAWIAKKQKRWLHVIYFNGGAADHSFDPEKVNTAAYSNKLIDVFTMGASGGTAFDPVLLRIMELSAKHEFPDKQCDIISVGDGDGMLTTNVAAKFNLWRSERKVKHVFIGIECEVNRLDPVIDQRFDNSKLSLESKDVHQTLSI